MARMRQGLRVTGAVTLLGVAAPAAAKNEPDPARVWHDLVLTSLRGDQIAASVAAAPAVPAPVAPLHQAGTPAPPELPTSSGYWRIQIVQTGTTPTVPKQTCAQALGATDNIWSDILFARHYDVGLRATISMDPTSLPAPADVGALANRAELGLFRLSGESGRCQVDLNFFSSNVDPVFSTPWRPVDASNRHVWIAFDSWAKRLNDASTVGTMWRGIMGTAALVGPVKLVAAAVFGDRTPSSPQSDNRSQAQSALGLGESTTTVPPIWKQVQIVRDGRNVAAAPTDFTLRLGPDARPLYSIGYRFAVQYRGSMLTGSDDTPGLPEMDATLREHLGTASFAASLGAASAPLRNLSAQLTWQTFDAACEPADAAMLTAGLGLEDRVAVLYALARIHVDEADLGRIDCLSNADRRNALARWRVTLPDPINKSSEPQARRVADLLATVLAAPSAAATLRPYLSREVQIGGDGQALLRANAGSDTRSIESKALFPTGTGAMIVIRDCSMIVSERTGSLRFPDLSGIPDSIDYIFAQLVSDAKGEPFLVLGGLSGTVGNRGPFIDRLWVGRPQGKAAESLRSFYGDMLARPACVGNPVARGFFSPPPPAPAPPAPDKVTTD